MFEKQSIKALIHLLPFIFYVETEFIFSQN